MACLVGTLFASSVTAEEAWLTRSQQLLNTLQGQAKPAWLENNPHQLEARQQALEVFNASKSLTDLKFGTEQSPMGKNDQPLKVLFISFSLGESALKVIFEEVSGRDDVLLVFRGPKPGQKLPALMADLKRLLKDIDPVPNIVIDPTRFQRWSVTSVPDMVVEQDGQSRLHVRGVSSLSWLDQQLKAGKQGDLGTLGDVSEIAEIDLLEEIKRRMAAIDWKQKQQQTIARFWERQKFEVLPAAHQDLDRPVDLTITAPRDLAAPNGQLIIRAGQTVNPLEKMPFGLCLKVFDATVPAQVELIRHQSCQDKKAHVMYLATSLPRQDGWEKLKHLENTMQAPVYLLTPDVRSRFQLQHVPSFIEQSGNHLIVHERKQPVSSGERS
ncbi:TrbC family F-type conjugative pilus assembly protein [Methylomonas sp. OY6]|uniref:TrbC family F-type conjugative pilus assembly protein n=1 Tax=Methylomonas defluvii TaxID=3045149 RepID=A0ABU4UG60_9GAMM|nr:TrbC family F-type conjugative pilus assembly protein [Methylomonas sp. OY6]MDX8128098.1 TrbC family F-type conjugative pilus assembly protein [Methylomonas sp. OY6]